MEELLADASRANGTPITSPSELQQELHHAGHLQLARRVERLNRARRQVAHPDVTLRGNVRAALSSTGLSTQPQIPGTRVVPSRPPGIFHLRSTSWEPLPSERVLVAAVQTVTPEGQAFFDEG